MKNIDNSKKSPNRNTIAVIIGIVVSVVLIALFVGAVFILRDKSVDTNEKRNETVKEEEKITNSITVSVDSENSPLLLFESYKDVYGNAESSEKEDNESGDIISSEELEEFDNITAEWFPEDLDRKNHSGSHNGDANCDGMKDYIAYTFYLKNTGKDVSYNMKADVMATSPQMVDAIRVRIYRNEKPVTYGKKPVEGTEEDEYANFGIDEYFSADDVVTEADFSMKKDSVDKYTIVVWVEGWDPEALDDIMLDCISLSVNFSCA